MADIDSQGISRRDLLKRGAALGGAVVWATPVVQTLGMGRAFAASPSPVETRISFIALNLQCGDNTYTVKWENGGGWEDEPQAGNNSCSMSTTYTKANGGDLGVSTPTINGDCASLTLPPGCTLLEGIVWGAQICTPFTDPSNICL